MISHFLPRVTRAIARGPCCGDDRERAVACTCVGARPPHPPLYGGGVTSDSGSGRRRIMADRPTGEERLDLPIFHGGLGKRRGGKRYARREIRSRDTGTKTATKATDAMLLMRLWGGAVSVTVFMSTGAGSGDGTGGTDRAAAHERNCAQRDEKSSGQPPHGAKSIVPRRFGQRPAVELGAQRG